MTTSIADLKAALADRYRIERELGRGGMATVYLAHDLRHDRPVALKLLRPELAAVLGPERFLRETKLTARLQHPHILPLFDSGEASGQLWYVMPYVEGESLRARLARERQLPLEDALRITCNVLAALSYAHSQGVVHRDIKPENILLEGDEAVVADFGVARAAATVDERLTETGLALLSPRPQAVRDSVHEFLGLLALAEGRWSEAKREFLQVQAVIPSAKRLLALSATWPFLAVPDSDLTALRTELEQWDPGKDPPEANPGLASGLNPQLRLYLLGLLSSRLRQDAQALHYAAGLEAGDKRAEAGMLVHDLARTVRADVALHQGHPQVALKLLEPVRGEVPPELLAERFYSEEGSRYLRAEILYQLGRDDEALRWFSNGFDGAPGEIGYLAPSHLRQAELYERLGDHKQAVEHYSRFVQLWKACDPELRPSVERAKARLASLVAEPR